MKRVITAAIAIPIVLLVTLFAPNWLFAVGVGAAAAVSVEEFVSLGAKKGIGRPPRWFPLAAGVVSFSFLVGFGWVLTTFVLAVMSLMTAVIFGGPIETAFGRVVVGITGVAYCCLTLGFLVLMSRQLILVLFAVIWIGDTAAYYGGRAWGRHLLAPIVSPKKTIEGAIAGLIGSVAAGIIAAVWILGEPWIKLAGISALTALMGQMGDLAESALKRSVGVKDSSSILPGHGGILDRLDSLFFATPVFYWLFNL
jgi:phosphatidate cytidylyltransferase